MRLLILIVALLMSGAAPAVAGPLEDGFAAYNKGDYATALRLWRALADQGDARRGKNLNAGSPGPKRGKHRGAGRSEVRFADGS